MPYWDWAHLRGPVGDYGSFYDTTSQTGGSIRAFQLNTTDFADGVSIANNTLGNPTRITTTKIGKYNIAFSAQLHLSSGTSADVYFWMRHQEVDVPESATVISLGNNARKTVAAWNFFVEATTSPQYWEIMWYTTSTNVALDHFDDATTPVGVPAVPSLILTVNQVG